MRPVHTPLPRPMARVLVVGERRGGERPNALGRLHRYAPPPRRRRDDPQTTPTLRGDPLGALTLRPRESPCARAGPPPARAPRHPQSPPRMGQSSPPVRAGGGLSEAVIRQLWQRPAAAGGRCSATASADVLWITGHPSVRLPLNAAVAASAHLSPWRQRPRLLLVAPPRGQDSSQNGESFSPPFPPFIVRSSEERRNGSGAAGVGERSNRATVCLSLVRGLLFRGDGAATVLLMSSFA